ncbi:MULTISPECIES: AsmA2 domain-containing protein YhdP [Tenebrionibacter/Tenebrionicola group]|uniref:AsmA2 domain-containing protein YhdP n=2 Tax=Tenebrionibacter/Tenebrionicola group TaxID=2969848 RepID=A0A8K0V594_9ENTR|nr:MULTISPECIES: AsmA2 domain-containing protein YhdP [Tenebrionibacter/Tenebrionicola group]MBK4715370.1 AsmA2 domain-containing protein YhdP [Tenebrionibacter intestinalis]MBV5094499.1 AsmA2 domain-containing protein YhdP [Tenebrionicola larvae]
MRRLPGILLLIGATLIVIVALLVSGLRLLLPHLDTWRPALVEKIEQAAGVPVSVGRVNAAWRNFGPTLDVRNLQTGLKDGGSLEVQRVTLALDIWQSLLHLRWQFRDLTFYQMRMRLNAPLVKNNGDNIEPDRIVDLFLNQFDHFDLRDSAVSFVTPSGQRASLAIPQLTWLNTHRRHRAEGQISLSTFNGQHGVVRMRMDLRDDQGLLSNGTIWMQADDVDVTPWLSRWMNEKVKLSHARFSLQGWMTVEGGRPGGGDLLLKQGGATWPGDGRTHRLSVDNLTAHVSRIIDGWQIAIPDTRIEIDGLKWPKGALTLGWLPEREAGGPGGVRSEELRVRASNVELAMLLPLLPVAEKFAPEASGVWRTMQPQGKIEALALDIPLQQPEKTRLQGRWQDIAWRQWKLLPGVEHLAGNVAGSLENGRLVLTMRGARMPYSGVFPAPLDIAAGSATLDWRNDINEGFSLSGKRIDVQAKALWANGSFRYLQPKGGAPWLSILAGVRTADASQAWRYFPENLMGETLVGYLSGAIKGGQVDNATLVYNGNPHLFPYKHNEGQFEVLAPLRNATFAFQPEWPALKNLDIELDFLNDALWMKAPEAMLGDVKATNLVAAISDYARRKLRIDADIRGPGRAIGPYFRQTPLRDSLGATLNELQIDGDVSARLHLDIPLNGEKVTAKGDVMLRQNSLFIQPLGSKLERLSGDFSFNNGNLTSKSLTARWFNQPLGLNFTTHQGATSYDVGVNLNGNWQPAATGLLPPALNRQIKGSVPWKGTVAITLPYHGSATYNVALNGELKNVSSQLPSPLEKNAGVNLPVNVSAKGDLRHVDIIAKAGDGGRFNSRWLLGEKLRLDRAIWVTDSKTLPALPDKAGVELNLPPLDGAGWLALFQQDTMQRSRDSVLFPKSITLRTPALMLGGQRWNNLGIVSQPVSGGTRVSVQGRELTGTLMMRDSAPWQADINYLYYNPEQAKPGDTYKNTPFMPTRQISFSGWPNLALRCAQCWLWGQKYGRIDADLTVKGDTLSLSNGVLDTGFARLNAQGEWVNRKGEQRTSLKGQLQGKRIDAAASFFGASSPIQGASFNVDYDLHWRNAPWQPQEASLNGIVRTRFGKGQIAEFGTGHAGQVLRLLSFDALLRKLRLDFSDTFSDGFYFDAIRSTAWIKDGVLHTDDTLIDGLEADIAMKGAVNLVKRELNVEAVVAPEISATVGVATAFAINPIVGAAVFAASRVLGPLWSKISVLRYRITGPIERPQINEVLRQPRASSK